MKRAPVHVSPGRHGGRVAESRTQSIKRSGAQLEMPIQGICMPAGHVGGAAGRRFQRPVRKHPGARVRRNPRSHRAKPSERQENGLGRRGRASAYAERARARGLRPERGPRTAYATGRRGTRKRQDAAHPGCLRRKCFVHRRMTMQTDLKVAPQPLFSASLVPAVLRPPNAYSRGTKHTRSPPE